MGQLLSDTKSTKGGVISPGRNLIAAIMPYRRRNFEDRTVISEGAARALTSEHLYDLSEKLTSSICSSPARFTTYGKRHKIDAENLAQPSKG